MNNLNHLLLFLILIALLAACSSEINNGKKITAEAIETSHQLPLEEIQFSTKETVLNIEVGTSSKDSLTKASTANKQVENKPVEKIKKDYKKVNNLAEKVSKVKKDSFVTAKLLLQYADVLFAHEVFPDAINAYQEALQLGTQDSAHIYRHLARANGRLDNYEEIKINLKNLKRVQAQANIAQEVLHQPFYANFRTDRQRFMSFYNDNFKDNKAAMFDAFLAFCPKLPALPYQVNTQALWEKTNLDERAEQKYNKTNPIVSGYFNMFISGVFDAMFSREGNATFRYKFHWSPTKNVQAVIYTNEKVWSDLVLPKSYYLITYDNKGNEIDKLEIGNRSKLKQCKVFQLNNTKEITVTKYAIELDSSISNQLSENYQYYHHEHLLKEEIMTIQTYEITPKGKIVAQSNKLSMRS